MLIELVDGGIKEIYTDTESYGGCITCDYGSEYINEFKIYMTTGNITCKVNNMYEYALSEDYMMKLFLGNIDNIRGMEEQEFYQWIKNKLKTEIEDQVEELEIEFVWI